MGSYTWEITLTTSYDTIETTFTLDNVIDVPDGYSLVPTVAAFQVSKLVVAASGGTQFTDWADKPSVDR